MLHLLNNNQQIHNMELHCLRNSVNSKIVFYVLANSINANFYYEQDEPDKTLKNAHIRYEITNTSGDVAGLDVNKDKIVYFVKKAGSNEEEIVTTFFPS